MASLTIYFNSGECLAVGSSPEAIGQAYSKLASSDAEFVDLSSIPGLSKIAIRPASIDVMLLDPNDVQTVWWHSAMTKAQRRTVALQLDARKLTPSALEANPTAATTNKD
jgi:hypothetical protein